MFDKILIANRGEIACRVIRTANKLGVKTVAVYSEADKNAMHVQMATEAYCVGPPPVAESYLQHDKILDVATQAKAQAIHPGYGFLSEDAAFAEACANRGVVFIGPKPYALRTMGSKSESKRIMGAAGVPITPGYHGEDQTNETLRTEASKIGYPVLIKAVMGGGGKGMRIVENVEDFDDALEACRRESEKSFGDSRVLIEKYLGMPRHIEVQVFGDTYGNVVHLWERDCSVQRRHQKVLEEAPAPGLSSELRHRFGEAAVMAAKAVDYVGAGTVEFLMDSESEEFYFCEMNTRLQVEHPVTELITQQDLVDWQLQVASGAPLPIQNQNGIPRIGHAIEARVYAENPKKGFLPSTGKIRGLFQPEEPNLRIDTGIQQGDEVTVYYDPMIAKVIYWGKDRHTALNGITSALRKYKIIGVSSNVEFLECCASHPKFQEGGVNTGFLEEYAEEVGLVTSEAAQDTEQPVHMTALASVILNLYREKRIPLLSKSKACQNLWNSVEGSWRLFGNTSSWCTFETKEQDVLKVPVKCKRDGSYSVELAEHPEGLDTKVLGVQQLENGSVQVKIQLGHEIFTAFAFVELNQQDETHDVHIWDVSSRNHGIEHQSIQFTRSRQMYRTTSVLKTVLESSLAGNEKPHIKAPMPGKIIKVLVEERQKVKAGDPLIILEAMKMEHVIAAPMNGVINDVLSAVGEMVSDESILINMSEENKDC